MDLYIWFTSFYYLISKLIMVLLDVMSAASDSLYGTYRRLSRGMGVRLSTATTPG